MKTSIVGPNESVLHIVERSWIEATVMHWKLDQGTLHDVVVPHSQTLHLKESISGVVWSPIAMLRCGGVIDGDGG